MHVAPLAAMATKCTQTQYKRDMITRKHQSDVNPEPCCLPFGFHQEFPIREFRLRGISFSGVLNFHKLSQNPQHESKPVIAQSIFGGGDILRSGVKESLSNKVGRSEEVINMGGEWRSRVGEIESGIGWESSNLCHNASHAHCGNDFSQYMSTRQLTPFVWVLVASYHWQPREDQIKGTHTCAFLFTITSHIRPVLSHGAPRQVQLASSFNVKISFYGVFTYYTLSALPNAMYYSIVPSCIP